LFIQTLSFRKISDLSVYPRNKTSKKFIEKIKDDIIKEVNILSSIRNKHIVEAYGYFEAKNTIYSVMEYIKGKNLLEYINSHHFNEHEIKELIFQIIDGLKEIHSRHIIHRDIKPENIMRTEEGVYKLIDFTNKKFYTDKTITISGIMTEGYTAPELLQKRGKVGAFSDIYSIGMTLYCILSKETPPSLADRVLLDDDFYNQVDKLRIDDKLKNCIKNMTEISIKDRISNLNDIKKCLDGEHKKGNKFNFINYKRKTFIIKVIILLMIVMVSYHLYNKYIDINLVYDEDKFFDGNSKNSFYDNICTCDDENIGLCKKGECNEENKNNHYMH